MLDVRRMTILREVARQGSIAGAARALSFTPSAVSQQISKLERETGIALLERSPRSVRLTEAGRALVGHADEILVRLARAEADVRARAEPGQRILRVGSFPTAGAMLLPRALAALAGPYPSVRVTVAGLDPLASLAQLRAGELDLGLLFEYDFVPLPRAGGVELELLLEEDMGVVLPRGHAAAGRRSVPLAELADEIWIKPTPSSSCQEFTARACEAAGFSPRIGFEFDDYQTMQTLVAASVGVAFAPMLTLSTVHPDVIVRPVAFRPPRRRIYAATLSAEGDAVSETMLRVLHEAAAALTSPVEPAAATPPSPA